MIVLGTAEIHHPVYNAGRVDQIVRQKDVFRFIDFNFIKFRTVCILVAEILIKQIVSAKLQSDGIPPFEALDVFAVQFAAEYAVVTLHVALPFFGAVHIIVQIIGIRVDGSDAGGA